MESWISSLRPRRAPSSMNFLRPMGGHLMRAAPLISSLIVAIGPVIRPLTSPKGMLQELGPHARLLSLFFFHDFHLGFQFLPLSFQPGLLRLPLDELSWRQDGLFLPILLVPFATCQ